MTPTCDDLLILAGALAPEVVDRLYILPYSTDVGPVRHDSGAFAVRAAVRHAGIRDALVSAGQWRGWRDVIVFVEPPSVPILLHELAHVLPSSGDVSDVEPTREERSLQHEAMSYLATHTDDGGREPWRMHGADWIRRVIHLAHRAEQIGVSVRLADCHVAGPHYGLSDVDRYASALGAEPIYLSRASFAEIDTEPLLEPFAKLFEKDTRLWTS